MNTKPQNNTQNKEQVVLPLLNAKEANRLANNVDRDEELQKVADMIRQRATNGYTDVVIPFISNVEYIEKELSKNGYVVIYKDVFSLNISWR